MIKLPEKIFYLTSALFIFWPSRIIHSVRIGNIEIIDKNKNYLISNSGIIKIGVFGSIINNKNNESSDIDILVQFKKGHKGFFNYMKFKFYLEKLFQKEVDLVMIDAVKPKLKNKILSKVRYV